MDHAEETAGVPEGSGMPNRGVVLDGGTTTVGVGIGDRASPNGRAWGEGMVSEATPGPDETEVIEPQQVQDLQTVGYVENHLSVMMEYASENVLETREGFSLQNAAGDMILDTHFSPNKGGHWAAYLAVLASVGLYSPVASHEKQGEEDQCIQGQDVNNHFVNSPRSKIVGDTITPIVHRLSPLKGKIWKNKGKSPLGRRWGCDGYQYSYEH